MLFLLAGLALASASIYSGTAKSPEGFAFVGKFCVDVSEDDDVAGTVEVNLTVPGWVDMKEEDKAKYADYELWLFDDEKPSWPAIYKTGLPCSEARKRAKNTNKEGVIYSNYRVQWDDNGQFSTGEGNGNIKQKMRPRFWFMALAHCKEGGSHELMPTEYQTHWVNTQRGPWGRELGANEAGLNTLYLCAFLVYIPFMVVHFYGVVQLSRKLEYVHPMVKLFAVVVFLQSVVVILNMLHWGHYKNNGKGIPILVVVADGVDLVVRTLFVLILMLISQGWTISGDELTGKKQVLGMVGSYFVISALILLWQFADFDPAATSPVLILQISIYLINFVWVGLAVWFGMTIYKSFVQEDNPVKKTLYRNLAFVYFPWFFGLPAVSILTLMLSPWVAMKAYSTVSVLFSMFGFFVLSFLLWPSRAEEYFNISTPDVMQANIDTYEQL